MKRKKRPFDLLYEDTTLPNSTYVTGGYGQTHMQPRKINILDLVDQQRKYADNAEKTPNILPYPLSEGVVEKIGDIFVNAHDVKMELKRAYKNPVLEGKKDAKKAIHKIYKGLGEIQDLVEKMSEYLDELVLDSAQK